MKALALDFDGVISDSAPEAFVVALRTFVKMRPASTLNGVLAAIEADGGPRLDRIRSLPVYASFLDMMPLGNRAEDYAVELLLLEGSERVAEQAAYDARRDEADARFLRAFHKRFYETREAFSRENPEAWRALLAPYPAFVRLLRRRADDALLAIATSKDRRSVGILLCDYGIDDLFPDARIFDKETGVHKTAHLARLQAEVGLDWSEITFLDDKVNHLDAVASLGVRCALSAWGYNGARERRQASERGHLVCTLDDVEEQLFG